MMSVVRLTRRGAVVTGISAGLLVLGKTLGVAEFSVLGIAGIALVLMNLLALHRIPRRCLGTREVQKRSVFGAQTVNHSTVRGGHYALLGLSEEVAGPDRTFSMQVAGPALRFHLPTDHRGTVHVGPLRVTARDPFGLVVAVATVRGVEQHLVHPERVEVAQFTNVVVRRVGTLLRGGLDAASVRAYQPGDRLRAIHWRASARQPTLMVREEREDERSTLVVLIDLRPHELLEVIIATAFSVSCEWLSRGTVRLIDHRGALLFEGHGGAATTRLGDVLAVVESTEGIPTSRAGSSADIVVSARADWSSHRGLISPKAGTP